MQIEIDQEQGGLPNAVKLEGRILNYGSRDSEIPEMIIPKNEAIVMTCNNDQSCIGILGFIIHSIDQGCTPILSIGLRQEFAWVLESVTRIPYASGLMMKQTFGFGVVALLLAGCFWRGGDPGPAAAQRLIRVDWYGEQSFKIQSSLGTSILTNPFAPGTTSFEVPKGPEPDILLVSHEESKANYVDIVDNNPRIFRGSVGVGTNSASGISILGVPTFLDPESQDITGMNVIYRWTMDGLRFCFLGNVRGALTPEQISRIGAVDVLFVPVGTQGLSIVDRDAIVAALRPWVVIPMGSYAAVSRYASGFSTVYRLNSNGALLSRERLPAQQTVLLFRAP